MEESKIYFNSCVKFLFVLFVLITVCAADSFSQEKANKKDSLNFSGSINISNNGFDLVPAFDLGKPDISFYFSAGGRRFAFQPQFRFSLGGMPWKLRLVIRYRLVDDQKFRIELIGTPVINFKTSNVTENGIDRKTIEALRYGTVEIASTYFLPNSKINPGFHYQYSRRLEKGFPDIPLYSHVFGLNCLFTGVGLFSDVALTAKPELYYLILDDNDGFYASSVLTLSKGNFPLGLFSIINKSITSNIPNTNKWNVGVVYWIFR